MAPNNVQVTRSNANTAQKVRVIEDDEQLKLRVKRLSSDAVLPYRGSSGAAGCDFNFFK